MSARHYRQTKNDSTDKSAMSLDKEYAALKLHDEIRKFIDNQCERSTRNNKPYDAKYGYVLIGPFFVFGVYRDVDSNRKGLGPGYCRDCGGENPYCHSWHQSKKKTVVFKIRKMTYYTCFDKSGSVVNNSVVARYAYSSKDRALITCGKPFSADPKEVTYNGVDEFVGVQR